MRYVLIGVGGLVALAVGGIALYLATLYTAGSAQDGHLALVGGTVLVGDRLEPVRDATVLVHAGAIAAVGPSGAVEVPADAAVIDVTGLTVLPGLIDLHVHLGSPQLDAHQEPALPVLLAKAILNGVRLAAVHRRAALEHGVTTVRNLGDDHGWIMDLRGQIEGCTLEGPRVFASGPLFTAAGGHPIATFGADPASDFVRVPTTAAEARREVRALATGEPHMDLIKVVQERGGPDRPLEPIAPDVLEAIVAEAHAQGLTVVAHWGTFADLEELLDAGVDGLEHMDSRDLLAGWRDDLLAQLVERDLPITATLTVSQAALPPDVMPEVMETLRRRVGEFRAATSEAARVLLAAHLGAVAPGRAADLLVVEGDPTSDIAAVGDVVLVFRDGRLVVDRRGED